MEKSQMRTNDKLIYASDIRRAILKQEPRLAYLVDGIRAVDAKEVIRAKWKLGNYGKGTCTNCNFTQNGVWDYDHHQRFCGVCGAEMELEGI
jgi:hypothetical protein